MRPSDRQDMPAPPLLRAPSRRSEIPSFIVMDVMQAAAAKERAGDDVIHMEVGQPGTPAPKAALERVRRALSQDKLGYSLARGMPDLRQRIAAAYGEWYGIDVAPQRVIVTNGSSAAFVLAFLALFDPGDSVALPSPGYPCYRHILSTLGQKSVILDTDEQSRWMPTIAQIEAAADHHNLAGLLIASPANPTGTMLQPARLAQIVALCRARKMWFISDEIYHGLTYQGPAQTALQYGDDVIIINSFSKYFSMTGWRIGWMIVPEALVRSIERLTQNLYIAAPSVSQVAALGAFDGRDELEANKDIYAANRKLLLEEFPKAGLHKIAPADGGFYLYVDVSHLTDDALSFTARMLDETGIAATPGLDFDETRGAQFVRFSYAGPTEKMAQAAQRLRDWLK